MGKVSDYAKKRQPETYQRAGGPNINPVFPRPAVGAPVENIKDTRTAYDNYGEMSVEAILEAVKVGQMNAAEVVALEQTGKKRKGILKGLGAPVATEVQVEDTDPVDPPADPPAPTE